MRLAELWGGAQWMRGRDMAACASGGAGCESDDPGAAVLPVVWAVGSALTCEVSEWLALHRAQEGCARKLNGEYFTLGRPVADFLAPAFDDLVSCGLLALGRADPLGWQQVCVTRRGQVRYAELHTITARTGMAVDERR